MLSKISFYTNYIVLTNFDNNSRVNLKSKLSMHQVQAYVGMKSNLNIYTVVTQSTLFSIELKVV